MVVEAGDLALLDLGAVAITELYLLPKLSGAPYFLYSEEWGILTKLMHKLR